MSKTVIIGGVAGGATAAARLRRLDENMEIVMLEKGNYISFANCGLPYHIGSVIKSRDALLLQTPEEMKKRFNVDVRIQNKVVSIDRENKSVTVENLRTGETYEESYDYLIVATGSSPNIPPIPGVDSPKVMSLWTIPDMDKINSYISQHNTKTVTVVGGGFIGLEMAENLRLKGLNVSVVEHGNQVMAPIDFDMAQIVHENMEANGIKLFLSEGVTNFEDKKDSLVLSLSGGHKINSDFAILSAGIKPNSEIAKSAYLDLNQRNGIVVSDALQTTEDSIYAAGDVIEVNDPILGGKTMIPLAGPANKQGRIAADNIASVSSGNSPAAKKTYRGSFGTSVAQVFDYTVAATGANEKRLIAAGMKKGIDYEVIIIDQRSHAGYYPDSTIMTIKLIFKKSGEILGAQIVGQSGVDKRIDTIATTMQLGGTIHDLAKLELAYAPPYSSAKDPVNMAGFVAENVIDGLVSFITPAEVEDIRSGNTENSHRKVLLLDIREQMEHEVYAIPDSLHIPFGEIRDNLDRLQQAISELDSKTPPIIAVYCAIGVRAYNVARILMQKGFENVKVLSGGTTFYKSYFYNFNGSNTAAIPSNPSGGVGFRQKDLSNASRSITGTPSNSCKIVELDCCGLQCPGPIMKVNEHLQNMAVGDRIEVSATDMGFANDIDSYCCRTGNTLIETRREGKKNIVVIERGTGASECQSMTSTLPQGKSIIVFSGDLDKVLASFIIANGAAAMGRPVTMFFTFWGLNALRKSNSQKVNKTFIEKMFGMMMPRGTEKLSLSKMNMGGLGTKMMKFVMKNKNVATLPELMKAAMDSGVRLVACTMSMDIMGIKPEELLDGVEYAGVASYLGDAENSNVNLFI